MKSVKAFTLTVFFTLLAGSGCVAHTASSTTWVAPPPTEGVRPGRVEWIRETVQREHGDPVGGAVAGALLGGLLLGGDGPSTVIGMLGGAAVGAAASQGSAEHRQYEVFVRFDDGYAQIFLFPDYAPFRPGEPVVQTSQGLFRQQQ